MKLASLSFGVLAAFLVAACGGDPPPPPKAPAPTAPPTPPPAVTDPPPVVEGAVTQQTVNGLAMIVKRVPGAELAAMQLYIRGGARNWSAANAGVEQLALSVATTGGTQKLDKDAFSRKLTQLGSDLDSSSGNDLSLVSAKALTARVDETFGLMVDAFMTPALPASELDLQRQQMLSRLRHEEEDPDSRLRVLTHKQIFKGHPYENRAVGTAESVGKLGVDQVKAHLGELRQAGRLLLVVVGDVDAAHVAELVRTRLAGLPRGSWKETPLPPLAFAKSSLETVSAPLPTNYVQGTFTVPGWRDPDFFAAMVGMEHLGFRVFEEVRTKRNLSYAPHANLRWATAVPLGTLYVSAVDPDAAIKVMFDEAKKLKTQPLAPKDLAAAKSTFLTNHLASTESTDAQASWLGYAQLHYGDWRFETKLLDHVKAVTAEQVQAFANKHVQHLQVQVLGKANVDKALFGSL